MRVRTLVNPFSCVKRYPKPVWPELFPAFCGIIDVEIGCGTGSFLRNYAAAHPAHAVVGFEIRKKLVDAAQAKIAEQKLENAFLLWGNGHTGLEDMFDNNSIDRLFIFHPDPWIKRHHLRRRIINAPFLDLVHQKLKPDGCMYIATDVPDLWAAMHESIVSSQKFTHITDDPFWTTLYHTRWKEMSIEQKRSLFYGTFQK